MKMTFASLALMLAAWGSAVSAQSVIIPPATGVPIVNGGTYPAGTVYANGMAYPPGTVLQASATVAAPAVATVTPGVVTFGSVYPDYYAGSVYPYGYGAYPYFGVGIGYGYGYGGYGRGYGYYGGRGFGRGRR